jgi:hypothetical protein
MPGRMHGHGDQARPFGVQPRQSRGLAGDGGPGRWRGRGHAVALGGESGADRGHGGVQIVIKQARQSRLALVLAAWAGRELMRITTQQVVHAEPGRPGRLDHAPADQYVQQLPRLVRRGAGKGGDGVTVEAGARVQGRQAESPGGVGRQALIGPGEHRADVRGRIALIGETVQAWARGQVGGHLSQGQVRAHRGAGGDDAERQRQART